jgi:hypothetical protein
MNGKNFLTMFFLATALVASACSKKENGSSSPALPVHPDSKSSDTSSARFKDSYQFEFNGCKTGKHEFVANSSAQEVTSQLCSALQDETLNNFCAADMRREYFEKKCANQSWKPFVSSSAESGGGSNHDSLPAEYQKRALSIGQTLMEVPITSPNGAGEVRSELTIVSCFATIQSGVESGYNGFILLGNSKAVIVRDTNYRFGDGKTASNAAPVSIINCNGNRGDEITPSNYQERKLKAGQSVMDVPITSPNGGGQTRSEVTFVTCVDNAVEGSKSGRNGLILLTGSKAVIVRDTNYRFRDGTSAASAAPVSVITCNR